MTESNETLKGKQVCVYIDASWGGFTPTEMYAFNIPQDQKKENYTLLKYSKFHPEHYMDNVSNAKDFMDGICVGTENGLRSILISDATFLGIINQKLHLAKRYKTNQIHQVRLSYNMRLKCANLVGLYINPESGCIIFSDKEMARALVMYYDLEITKLESGPTGSQCIVTK